MSAPTRPGVSYGRALAPVTPYQKAAQVWDERLGSARVQARNWRLACLGALAIAGVLAAGFWHMASRSSVVPYVVEVDALGAVRAVGPALEAHHPNDGQIAYHLAEFVEHVRAVPIDPVVLRKNWLRAYAFVTSRAATRLSDYARTAEPFRDVGVRTVTVEMTSAVRSSETSFELRWREDESLRGGAAETSRHTALLSYVVQPPADAAALRANPLGIYITDFHWSRDLVTGDKP